MVVFALGWVDIRDGGDEVVKRLWWCVARSL